MPITPGFLAASRAAWFWPNTVATVAELGERGAVRMAYQLLLSDDANRQGNLQSQYEAHAPALRLALEDLAAISGDCGGPIRWPHGRGLSGMVRSARGVYPHIWSSAHEAALELAELMLDRLVAPLPPAGDPEQQAVATDLLTRLWRHFTLSEDEVAGLQARIRHDQAVLLRGVAPVPAPAAPPAAETWRKWSPDRDTELRRLQAAGLGWRAIAEALACSYDAARGRFTKLRRRG